MFKTKQLLGKFQYFNYSLKIFIQDFWRTTKNAMQLYTLLTLPLP